MLSLKRVSTICHTSHFSPDELSGLLSALVPSLRTQLSELRSKVIVETCTAIISICETLQSHFTPFVSVIEPLVVLIRNSKNIMAESAEKALERIVQKAQISPVLEAVRKKRWNEMRRQE